MPVRRLFIIAAVAVWLSSVGGVEAAEFTFDYQKIVEISDPITLELNVSRGSVSVTGGEDEKLIIEATKRVRATTRDEAEEVADHIEIKVAKVGDKVFVKTNYLKILSRNPSFWQKFLGAGGDSYGSVEYTIALPLGCSVRIKSVEADILLSNIEGEVQVENTVGTTHGEFIFGPITVRQPQGEISLKWIEGDIRIKSSSGKVSVQQTRGAVDVTTLTGEVKIQTELDSPQDCFIETTSGSITFLIPETSSGVLNIETLSGEIQTEMPVTIKSVSRHRLVGEFGRGGPTITLSSSSGDVTVALY